VSPSSREREYAKRRYEKWQAKQAERLAAQRRARRNGLIAVGAVAGVLLIVGAVTYFSSGTSRDAATTFSASPGATASAGSEATASASAGAQATPGAAASPSAGASNAAAANNPCATPPARSGDAPKSYPSAPDASLAAGKTWNLAVETTCGPLAVTLDGAKAPKAVASTIFLARNGFWNGSPCHRLTTSGIYVLQCGDPTGTGTGGPGYSYGPVENAPAGDVYPAGTVAMARQGGKGDSMGSQFFLVYKDSTIPSDNAGGYTVIGKIVGGLDVVEKVAAGGVAGGGGDGAPTRAVSITSTTVS
jgi:peptidyl-prolyl cis-trans isomerase B (cyclophilin B)